MLTLRCAKYNGTFNQVLARYRHERSMKSFSFLLISLILYITTASYAKEVGIEFIVSGESRKFVTIYEMKNMVKPQKITYFDPYYAKSKTFEAFPIGKLLFKVFGKHLKSHDFTNVVFIALDGYRAISSIEILQEAGGYLAFRDTEFPDWEPVGRKRANPGPFYLFWTEKDQSAENGYPWPWQVAAIRLVRFQDEYPKVFPQGVAKNSSVYHGFEIFRKLCFRCHAISNQGGKIGPDLNEPQNILTYRSIGMVKAMIKEPSKFRHTYMPDHPHLTENDLDSLIDFFLFKSRER